MLEFSIISISTFVTVLNEVVKYMADTMFKKDIKRYIPMFSIIFGIVLGIIGFYIPNVEMGNNIVEAIFIGIAAGSAATGVNQIGKQLYKKDINGKDINDQINEIVDKTESTVITIKVFKQSKEFKNGVSDFKKDEVDDELNPADEQLKKYTLNLDSNYSSKNSVNIFIDSWT